MEPSSPLRMESHGLQGLLVQQTISMELHTKNKLPKILPSQKSPQYRKYPLTLYFKPIDVTYWVLLNQLNHVIPAK